MDANTVVKSNCANSFILLKISGINNEKMAETVTKIITRVMAAAA